MALVIDLKPNEKVIVGNSVITNDKQRTRLMIDGDAPILREKDTMTEDSATTPSKKLYLTIQNMYLANPDRAMDLLDAYFSNQKIIKDLAPHMDLRLNDITRFILQGTYYKALKSVQDLIEMEQDSSFTSEEKQASGLNQTHMEAQMLSQAADQLENLYENWDNIEADERQQTVAYNRKLWMIFFDGVNDGHKNTKQLQNKTDEFDLTANIINLYNFIYKRSNFIVENADKEGLKTLVHINRETALALLRNQ